MDFLIYLPILIIVILVLWLLFKLLKWPLKILWKLILNAALGFVILFVFNLFGGLIGFTLDINWISALVAGVFGVLGVIALIVVELLR